MILDGQEIGQPNSKVKDLAASGGELDNSDGDADWNNPLLISSELELILKPLPPIGQKVTCFRLARKPLAMYQHNLLT